MIFLKKLVFWTLTSDYDYDYHTITPSIWRLSLTIDFIIILEHYSADDFPHNDFSPDDFPLNDFPPDDFPHKN